MLHTHFQDFTHVKVAIVGRPNVGKSTLFNRIAGRQVALTSREPGLTRDRIETHGNIYDLKFSIIDTPGLEEMLVDDNPDPERKKMTKDMLLQSSLAIQSADVVIFLVDGANGITGFDEHYAQWIRKHLKTDKRLRKRVILVANKCESKRNDIALRMDFEHDSWSDVYRLGLGEPICISAEYREGFQFLYQELLQRFQEIPKPEPTEQKGSDPHNSLSFCIISLP